MTPEATQDTAGPMSGTQVGPHPFARRGWRFLTCRHCYWSRSSHPVHFWAVARPLLDNRHLTDRECADLEFRRHR